MNDPLYWTDPDGTFHERCALFFVSTGESVPFDPGAYPELGWRRYSLAYFCSECGEIWERIVLFDSRGKTRPFDTCLTVACAQHTDLYNVPGSRLAWNLEPLLPLLPEGVLRLEAEVHMTYYTNQHGESHGSSSQRSASTG